MIIVVRLYNITDAITELNNLKHNNTVINQPTHKTNSPNKKLKKVTFIPGTRRKIAIIKERGNPGPVFASDLSITGSFLTSFENSLHVIMLSAIIYCFTSKNWVLSFLAIPQG